MSLIQVENLSHSFGDKVVFSNVCFRLLKGEHVGLLGANGSGKSTFLNMVSGKILYDEGRLNIASGIKIGYLEQYSDYDPSTTIMGVLRNAFKPLLDIEQEIFRIADDLNNASPDARERLLNRMGRMQQELDGSDFYMMDGLIEDAASGLGFKQMGLDTPVGTLSGGMKIKLMLARLLLEKPDVLLLDEPTNYLDAGHIAWLAGFLSNYEGRFILVSHDIPFLNRVTNVIWHMEFARMTRYPGNYEKFIKLSGEKREKYLNDYALQQRQIAHMEDFVRKNIVRASTTGRAQSRQKALDRIERLEKPAAVRKPSFTFTYSREPDKIIFETLELEVGYEKTLLPKLSLCLERGMKAAVTGFNGIGKTTLLKSLLGLIPIRGGIVEYGRYVAPAYFEQEEKTGNGMTALETVWNEFPRMSQQDVRKALARCGLSNEHIMMPVKTLSGGERSKVRLCMLMLKPSNFLVLDEPTNHLDRDAKDALRDALVAYKGAVLLVCHEESFFRGWVDKEWNLTAINKNKAAAGK